MTTIHLIMRQHPRLTVLFAAMCSAGIATAQETPDPAVQTVQVTGQRSSNLRTIAAKRDALIALDTIAANEIGQLPDFNVGDALKRVTGVNTLLYQGEPRFVIVRGLNANYNTTLIDGFTLPSADVGGRQVYMELLPSNFARRIDVAKSSSPELDGGAIGGVVNIVTGGAFNHARDLTNVSAKLGRSLGRSEDGGSRPVGEATAKWSRRFGSERQFGLALDASYWRRDINVPQLEAGGSMNWYDAGGVRQGAPYSGNGIAVPSQRLWYNYDNRRERSGASARLDWKGQGMLSGHVSAFDFSQKEDSDRRDLTANVPTSARVSQQSATGGVLSAVNQTAQLGRLRWDRELYGVNGELLMELAPQWRADLRASVARSTVRNPQTWENFVQNGLVYAYDTGAGYPLFTPANPALANDPARYALSYHREEETRYASRVNDLQFNLRHNDGDDDHGWGGAFGLRLLDTDMWTAFDRTSWNGNAYSLADVTDGAALCGYGCNGRIPLIAPALADAAFARLRGRLTRVVDKAARDGATYAVRERVDAGHAQARYRGERWLVLGGVRLEHTRTDNHGLQSVNGVSGPADTSGSYTNALPSLLAVIDTSDAGKLRLGWSKTVGRPRFDQMATRGGALNTTGAIATLSTGNPDLKPRKSTNIDLGHDWYLDGGRGIVSLALFHKSIADEIFTFGQTIEMDVNGASLPVLVTQARNARDSVRLGGVEFGATKDFDFLPAPFNGLGASVNATLIRVRYPMTLSDGSSTTLHVMPEQPKRIWNMALYYDKGRLRGRLAWNHIGQLWDDRYPNFTPAEFYRNRYQRATDNVDLQISYDLRKDVTLSLDVQNLTSQGIRTYIGREQEIFQSALKLRPNVLLGLQAKF